MMKFCGKIAKVLVTVACICAVTAPTIAAPIKGSTKIVNIRSDRGGQIIRYALRAKKYARSGSELRFSGRCDSACTLFLSMPKSKLCIKKGASFGFHLPYGSRKSSNATAARYMLMQYPSWVRSWIKTNGGLKKRIERMDYAYASKHLKPCAGGKKRFSFFRI